MASNVINIRNFVDVTTGVATTPLDTSKQWDAVLFVQKGAAGAATTVVRYESLQEMTEANISNTEGYAAAQQFYGTSYNGVTPGSVFYIATIGAEDVTEFTNGFTALMSDGNYYLVLLDKNFTDDQRMAAITVNTATQAIAEHKLFLDDYSPNAVNEDLETDTTSITAKAFAQKATNVDIEWSNAGTKKYYSAANAAYYATRQFAATNRVLAPIAHKPVSGIAPVDFTDAAITVTPSQAWANLTSKNGNAYINVKFVGLSAWERGTTPAGNDMSDLIAADYLNYTVTMAIWNLMQTTPRIPMNETGATMLRQAIAGAYDTLADAGIITTGISLDGESFSGRPYNIQIEIPRGVDKANGVWKNISTSALLAGSTRKVIITNDLKQ